MNVKMFWRDNYGTQVPPQVAFVFPCLDGTFGSCFYYVGDPPAYILFADTPDPLIKHVMRNRLELIEKSAINADTYRALSSDSYVILTDTPSLTRIVQFYEETYKPLMEDLNKNWVVAHHDQGLTHWIPKR